MYRKIHDSVSCSENILLRALPSSEKQNYDVSLTKGIQCCAQRTMMWLTTPFFRTELKRKIEDLYGQPRTSLRTREKITERRGDKHVGKRWKRGTLTKVQRNGRRTEVAPKSLNELLSTASRPKPLYGENIIESFGFLVLQFTKCRKTLFLHIFFLLPSPTFASFPLLFHSLTRSPSLSTFLPSPSQVLSKPPSEVVVTPNPCHWS